MISRCNANIQKLLILGASFGGVCTVYLISKLVARLPL
jgi:hypothetical protein